MGIEPTSSAWKAEVIAIIRRTQSSVNETETYQMHRRLSTMANRWHGLSWSRYTVSTRRSQTRAWCADYLQLDAKRTYRGTTRRGFHNQDDYNE